MRKTLADIFWSAWAEEDKKQPIRNLKRCDYVATKAVADAVTKRIKRKLAADARRNDMAKSEWVLR